MSWQEAHAKLGKQISSASACASAFTSPATAARRACARRAKYYEENMKMFGELRLVARLARADRHHARPQEAPTAEAAAIEEAVANGGFLCGSPAEISTT